MHRRCNFTRQRFSSWANKTPRMFAHDNFLFSSLPENGKTIKGSHGYDTLAKARRTLRKAAHAVLV